MMFPELRVDGERLLCDAIAEYKPRKTFVLFSGGNDSTVLVDWACRLIGTCKPLVDGIVHIDTGTALPGVREFVENFAARYEQPLLTYEAGDAYRELVLEHGGFPGPAGHGRAYTRLKERQIERLVRDHKHDRFDRVMLVTGKRRQESKRRAKTTAGVERRGAQVWVNPLLDWTREDMRTYRKRWNLPESDVAALIHRSGECNCGAFAGPGEREELRSLWPEWFAQNIEALEQEAVAQRVPACVWGARPQRDDERLAILLMHGQLDLDDDAAGPMCSDCELRADTSFFASVPAPPHATGGKD